MLSKKAIIGLWTDVSFPGCFSGLDTFYRELGRKYKKIPSKRVIQGYLSDLPTYQIHSPYPTSFPTRHLTNVTGVGLQLQADLAFMPLADNYKGFLLCVDELNNYIYAHPFQTKSETEILLCFQNIFKAASLKNCTTVSSDKGSEFVGVKKYFKNITWLFLTNKHKAFLAEYYIKIVKGRLYRALRENLSQDWTHFLPSIVQSVNATFSARLGMSPAECNDSSFDDYLRSRAHPVNPETPESCSTEFKINDYVFKALPKDLLYKGFDAKSGQIYRVTHISTATCPFKYYLASLSNKEIGWAYAKQLKKAPDPKTYAFPIEKIVSERGTGRKKEYYVKWLYYPSRYALLYESKFFHHSLFSDLTLG